MKQTCKAFVAGCRLVVVTKDDGSLGYSQEGEVCFLKSKGTPGGSVEGWLLFHPNLQELKV